MHPGMTEGSRPAYVPERAEVAMRASRCSKSHERPSAVSCHTKAQHGSWTKERDGVRPLNAWAASDDSSKRTQRSAWRKKGRRSEHSHVYVSWCHVTGSTATCHRSPRQESRVHEAG